MPDLTIAVDRSQELGSWLEGKIDSFVARNMLEPPEDTASFQPVGVTCGPGQCKPSVVNGFLL